MSELASESSNTAAAPSLRGDAGVEGSPADSVLDNCASAIQPLARAVYAELDRIFPDAMITADSDSIGFGTGPGYKYLVFSLLPYTKHVTIGFARGTELTDPAGLLEGAGKVHRHVKIRNEDDLRRPELADLFAAALARVGVR